MKKLPIAVRIASAKDGVIVIKRSLSRDVCMDYIASNKHKIRSKIVSVEAWPNSSDFVRRLFTPCLYIELYDGKWQVMAKHDPLVDQVITNSFQILKTTI